MFSADISLRSQYVSHILLYIYFVSTVVFVMYTFLFVDYSSVSPHYFVAYDYCSILVGLDEEKIITSYKQRSFCPV